MKKQEHNQELIQEIRENNRMAPKDKQIKFKIIRNPLYICHYTGGIQYSPICIC